MSIPTVASVGPEMRLVTIPAESSLAQPSPIPPGELEERAKAAARVFWGTELQRYLDNESDFEKWYRTTKPGWLAVAHLTSTWSGVAPAAKPVDLDFINQLIHDLEFSLTYIHRDKNDPDLVDLPVTPQQHAANYIRNVIDMLKGARAAEILHAPAQPTRERVSDETLRQEIHAVFRSIDGWNWWLDKCVDAVMPIINRVRSEPVPATPAPTLRELSSEEVLKLGDIGYIAWKQCVKSNEESWAQAVHDIISAYRKLLSLHPDPAWIRLPSVDVMIEKYLAMHRTGFIDWLIAGCPAGKDGTSEK